MNAQLDRIEIRGFKSIKECNLKLNSINVLIGSNGAGKSNFISVFSLMTDVLKKSLQLEANKCGINSLFYNGIKITQKIEVETHFKDDAYGFSLIPTDDNRVIFEDEYFIYQENREHHLGSGHSESRLNQNIDDDGSHSFPILKNPGWRVYHFHDTSRYSKIKQEHNLSDNRMLHFDASNLAAFLYRLKQYYPKNYQEIVATVRLAAPYFDDFLLEPREANKEQIILKWQQKGSDTVFNASQLSDGTLRFMCLAALFLQPLELQPSAVIVDEPELGLHPYAITILAEMVRKASVHRQIILSTQSVDLVDEFDVEDIVVVDRNRNGSAFRRLDSEALQEWLENDYTIGELWQKNILGGRLSG